MKLTGDHVWGPYPDPDHAVHVLRGVVDAGITLIDTADVYGPHVGLSNVTLEQLRIAQSIVPIAAVTALYNVTVRVGADLLAAAEADGIAFVPWHPVTTTDGLLASRAAQVLPPIAATHGAGVRQIALAWQLQGSPQALPIPGTTSLAHLRENLAAWSIVLSEREMRAIDAIATPGDLA
jgi:hypothetical protein